MKQRTIESLLDEAWALADKQHTCMYNILFRNAGVGISWWEEARCTTPENAPHLTPMGEETVQTLRQLTREVLSVAERRTEEGLVVYHYYRTLREALRAEISRLKKKEKNEATD